VRKVGQAKEHEVKVVAVCLDADVSLLQFSTPGNLWEDLEAVQIQAQLPQLQVCHCVVRVVVQCNVSRVQCSVCRVRVCRGQCIVCRGQCL
jgi:hypothetical protein